MTHILLLEDYDSLRKIYDQTLKAEGYAVYVAADGKEGLELAQKKEVDLILLDLLMPGLGGIEFLQAFDLKKHPKTKVIVLSNVFSPDLLNQVLVLGASQYLLKADITPKKLVEIVRQTLDEPSRSK